MTPEIVFDVAPDAPPIVRGTSAILKRSASNPRLAGRLRGMKGVVALRSSVDLQSVTIRFASGAIALESGVASDAGLEITLDFNDPSAKPKVKGATRHPLLALDVAKVMEPPTGTWAEEAAAFWAFASEAPRMPDALIVVCTDDGTEVRFGEDGGSTYEVHGSADALVSVFSGASIVGEQLLNGKIQVVGSLGHAATLTGRSIAWVMGEGR